MPNRSRLSNAEVAARVQLVLMPKRSVVKRTAPSAAIALHIDRHSINSDGRLLLVGLKFDAEFRQNLGVVVFDVQRGQ
jgi:hypothetical protein